MGDIKAPGLPFMPWFPARFMSSTRGWPVTARGVYRELLDCQWETGSLPATPSDLQRLIGANAAEWKFWRTHIEPKFPIDGDGKRRNLALEDHRSKSLQIRERNSRNGIAGNRIRWERERKVAENVLPFPGGKE